ncbi:MAG: hypothetical protein LRY69_01770 [Gammaproteobacteria bacterium]|nr:hypothetical protein [Gammaproteobacteria bacterium]
MFYLTCDLSSSFYLGADSSDQSLTQDERPDWGVESFFAGAGGKRLSHNHPHLSDNKACNASTDNPVCCETTHMSDIILELH